MRNHSKQNPLMSLIKTLIEENTRDKINNPDFPLTLEAKIELQYFSQLPIRQSEYGESEFLWLRFLIYLVCDIFLFTCFPFDRVDVRWDHASNSEYI